MNEICRKRYISRTVISVTVLKLVIVLDKATQ